MLNDHLHNCSFWKIGECDCGFDPALPLDEAKVIGGLIAMIILFSFLGFCFLLLQILETF